MEDVVRRGGTFYLTPEGRYTTTGRMLPMRGVVERLAPLATIYLAGVSYDPFVARRLSMLYRVVRFDGSDLGLHHEDARGNSSGHDEPTARNLARWRSAERFTGRRRRPSRCASAWRRCRRRIFVDPELRRSPRAMVGRGAAADGLVADSGARRRRLPLSHAARRHPQFPFVDDILAFQARFLDETLENAAFADGA